MPVKTAVNSLFFCSFCALVVFFGCAIKLDEKCVFAYVQKRVLDDIEQLLKSIGGGLEENHSATPNNAQLGVFVYLSFCLVPGSGLLVLLQCSVFVLSLSLSVSASPATELCNRHRRCDRQFAYIALERAALQRGKSN